MTKIYFETKSELVSKEKSMTNFEIFNFSLTFPKILYQTFWIQKNPGKVQISPRNQFSSWTISIFVQIFFLAGYGRLLSFPHVYKAIF